MPYSLIYVKIIEDMETGLDWAENTSDLIEFSDDVFSIIQISCIVILVLVSFLTGALLLDWFGKNPPICRTFMVWVILPVFSVLSLICMILAASSRPLRNVLRTLLK